MEKAGRNDPCPCGSQKKYKKCCGVPKKKGLQSVSVLSSSSKLASLFQSSVKAEEKKENSSLFIQKITGSSFQKQ